MQTLLPAQDSRSAWQFNQSSSSIAEQQTLNRQNVYALNPLQVSPTLLNPLTQSAPSQGWRGQRQQIDAQTRALVIFHGQFKQTPGGLIQSRRVFAQQLRGARQSFYDLWIKTLHLRQQLPPDAHASELFVGVHLISKKLNLPRAAIVFSVYAPGPTQQRARQNDFTSL